MLNLKPYAHYLVIFGLAMLLMAIGQVGQSHIAWADGTNYQTVPTRTPTPDPSGGSDEPDDSSQIIGVVTDLSTGNLGAGIIVRLNDVEIRTDTFGKYSLASLKAGEFTVSLVLEGEAVSAQEPVVVTVDGSSDVSVDLAYYSDPSQAQVSAGAGDDASQQDVAATPTTAPADVSDSSASAQSAQTSSDTGAAADPAGELDATANDNPPQLLPTSGRVGYPGWLMFGVGLVALILGLKFSRKDRF